MPQSFIVVGAGSAGCVIARRLIDAGADVTVLEAGGEDSNPAIHDPARQGELWHGPDDWDYYTVPQPAAAGRRLHLPRGKVLGGSHALNAMIWVRGVPSDYDHWVRLGAAGWGWADVLPVFRAIERYDGGPSELRGDSGLLDVCGDYPLHPVQQSILDAAVQSGVPHNRDYNGETIDGVSQEQVTMRDGRRWNTYLAYLKPVATSTRVITRARVHRLLVDHGRVTGVQWDHDGTLERTMADEVILAAGTIDSPKILLRSGIGPADEVRSVGVRPVVDLPGVGRNLHDHLLSPVIFATSVPVPPVGEGQSHTQTHLFARSRSGLDGPDTQPLHFSIPMYEPWMTGPDSGFTLMAGMIRPESRGSITLGGPDVDDEARIDPAALTEQTDLTALEYSVRQCRLIGRQPALVDGWGAAELYPGPDVEDDTAVRDYVRRTAITYHHQVGTCRMGTDDLSVVSPELTVHGLTGLRIADASVMPRITSGNTNAPTVMIAERAAAFIIGC